MSAQRTAGVSGRTYKAASLPGARARDLPRGAADPSLTSKFSKIGVQKRCQTVYKPRARYNLL
jgi:hypothetical protein